MAVDICPTITATDADGFRLQMDRIKPFAKRIHIDLMDGQFAPAKSLPLDQVWWPDTVRADLHVMYQKPFEYTDLLVALRPAMVIVHAEAQGDFAGFADILHARGIETGVALLPETSVVTIAPALDLIDHVLVFSGNLGHQGGSRADPDLLPKVVELRRRKPSLEIGWDGGVNHHNARALAKVGVDVLDVGGFIQSAPNPAAAYQQLEQVV